MKKTIKIIVFIILIIMVGIQFIPTIINKQSINYSKDFVTIYQVPKEISALLKTSCYDCHSNNTVYPWYSKFQPMNMFMSQHIEEGKDKLNLSEFGEYSDRRKKSKLKSMISQIKDDEMPLSSYTLLHWDASLSENDKKDILIYLDKLLSKI